MIKAKDFILYTPKDYRYQDFGCVKEFEADFKYRNSIDGYVYYKIDYRKDWYEGTLSIKDGVLIDFFEGFWEYIVAYNRFFRSEERLNKYLEYQNLSIQPHLDVLKGFVRTFRDTEVKRVFEGFPEEYRV